MKKFELENFKNYKYIIWDWNGTLLNDVELCFNIINNILRKYFLPEITIKEYKNKFCFPIKEFYENIGFNFSEISFEVIASNFINQYESNKKKSSLQNNSKKILKYLSENNIKQLIISAYPNIYLKDIINYYQISCYFFLIKGLDNHYANSKTQLAKNIIKELNIPFDKTLLIGDTIHDYNVAKEINVDSLIISNGHQSSERLLKLNSFFMYSLNDLL